jgi:small subunit ribosomal protein S15
LNKEKKTAIITDFAMHDGDTGSADVQVAVLTTRITQLSEHLKVHKKDRHSQYGLMLMIGRRKRLLTYVHNKDVNRYRGIIARLGLRK